MRRAQRRRSDVDALTRAVAATPYHALQLNFGFTCGNSNRPMSVANESYWYHGEGLKARRLLGLGGSALADGARVRAFARSN